MVDKILDALKIASDLIFLGQAIVKAASEGDADRVEELLPATLQVTIVRKAAEERARAKFGE